MAQALWKACLNPDLWQKATTAPETLTTIERRTIPCKPPSADEETALVLSRCSLTPVELQAKAINYPSSLTETECTIIIHGAHPITVDDSFAQFRDLCKLGTEGQDLHYRATEAVRSPEEKEALANARREADIAVRKKFDEAEERAQNPPRHSMVERILERRRDGSDNWGFVVFRVWFGEGSERYWEAFLSHLMGFAVPVMALMSGGQEVSKARKVQVVSDPELEEGGYLDLLEYFKGLEVEPGLEKTVFLVANEEAMRKTLGGQVPEMFVYASDAQYVRSAKKSERYEPTFKVELGQVFTPAGLYGTLLGLNGEKTFRDMYDTALEDPKDIFRGFYKSDTS